ADELRGAVASLEEEGRPPATLELHTSTGHRGYAEARLSLRARPPDRGDADLDGNAERLAPLETIERSAIASLGGELTIRGGPGARELALSLPPLRATDREVATPSGGGRGCVLVVDDEP